jgi:glycerol-3-phosphate acyltransferase PlsY
MLIWGVEPVILPIALMSLILIWRHEANIRKLLAGTESRLGQKATVAAHAAPTAHRAPRHPHKKGH